jgi:ribosome-associated translation inhibitor RaiA
VVRAWLRAVVDGDLPTALTLCAPDAILYTRAGTATTPADIGVVLAAWPYTGMGIDPLDVKGDSELGAFSVSWPGWGPDRDVLVRVEHGDVVELRIGSGEAAAKVGTDLVAVDVSAEDGVTEPIKEYAVDKVRRIVGNVGAPVLFASIKLRHINNPAAACPAQAEALLDVNGRAVRAHSAASTFTEAIDQTADRLGRRARALPHWSQSEGVPPSPGEWRHDNRPSTPPTSFARPREDRQIVHRTTVANEPLAIDEALLDMELLEYEFYLFTDLATGRDALVARRADGQPELSMVGGTQGCVTASSAALLLSPVTPPTLTIDAACEWLDEAHAPWLFFADATTGRGSVVYRRYDGHYGDVTPGR